MKKLQLQRKIHSNDVTVGLAWFSRDEWEKMRLVASDKHLLHDSYEEWLADIMIFQQNAKDMRLNITPVEVQVSEWLKWCSENQLPTDASSRSQYAAHLVELQQNSKSAD